MATISNQRSIYFNDVNILTGITKVNSRAEIPREMGRVFVSPMPSIVGKVFGKMALSLGYSLCLSRFCPIEKEVGLFAELVSTENYHRLFAAIGLNDWDRFEALYKAGCRNFVLDVANGTVPKIKDFCQRLGLFPIRQFMAGNVITSDTFSWLLRAMISNVRAERYLIRVGQGNGQSCATSDMTAINRGQITELIEIREWLDSRIWMGDKPNIWIISDGGVSKPASICKAFGAGADAVLAGAMFARTVEAETNQTGDGEYFGCASHKAQTLLGGGETKHSEGKEIKITENLTNLKDLTREIWGGVSSCVSYAGYKTLTDFIGKANFEIKQNSLPPKKRY